MCSTNHSVELATPLYALRKVNPSIGSMRTSKSPLQRRGRQLQLAQPAARGLTGQCPLAVVHRRAHPDRLRRRLQGALHAADQAATAAANLVVTLFGGDDGQRSAIRRDEQR